MSGKWLLTLPILLCTCFGEGFTQNTKIDFANILKTKNVDDIRQQAQKYIQTHKGTPAALFLQALLEEQADKAVEQYSHLVTLYPNSEFADVALYRIAHYYYARGLYISARRHFLNLVEQYPNSEYVDDAMYFAAACLFATSQFKTCYMELQKFLRLYPGSRYKALAREDLKEISVKKNLGPLYTHSNKKSKGKYTLQVGAFQHINNALKQREFFEKYGIPVEIREKNINGKTLYLVWVGSFETEIEARSYGNSLKKNYGKLYRIVELNP